VTIIGGLLLSQLLTLYTTPVVYLTMDRLSRRVISWRNHRRAEAIENQSGTTAAEMPHATPVDLVPPRRSAAE